MYNLLSILLTNLLSQMKKFLTFLVMMIGLFAPQLRAEALLTPEPGKQYMIMHSSGYFMTVTDNTVKIMSPGAGDSQRFTFEIAEDGEVPVYNIKLENGQYLGSDSGWTIKFLDDPADPFAQFQIWNSHVEDFVKIFNMGRGAYLGTDNNNDGGGIYTDKSGGDGKHIWKIVEASASGLITSGLEEAIENGKNFLDSESDNLSQDALAAINGKIAEAEGILANATEQADVNEAADALNAFINAAKNLQSWLTYANDLVANATIGTGIGEYPAEAADALKEAIAEATVWTEADTAVYNEAAAKLNTACTVFKNAQIVFFPDPAKKYYFLNTYSGLVMGINATNEAALATPSGEVSQLFEIEQSAESTAVFYLKLADGSGYLATKGGWNSTVVADYTDEARFQFELVDADQKVYTLNRFNLNGAWASDNNNPGDLIYTNKSRSQYNAQWQICEMQEGGLMTIGLEKAIAQAEEYIAKAVVGDQPGNYPQAAVDALTAAVAEAKNVLATATAQDQIVEAVGTLTDAINAFLAEKIDPYFIPEANTTYRYSVRKYASNYMTNEGEKVGTASFEPGDDAQHWTLTPVEGKKYTYILTNGGKALAYDATMVEIADAPAWTVRYTTTVNHLPYFSLVEADDQNKVLTFGSGKNPVIQDFNAGNDAHQGRFLRVDMPNDPNVFVLEQAVADARYVLENIDRGNEIGQYSDAKCDAFAAVIAAAEQLRGLTQDEVNAKAVELNAATTEFVNNPNAVVKDALDAAILAAKQTLAAATVGIQIGQYYQSQIDEFAALVAEFEKQAANVTDQEECDELTALVNSSTEAFTGNTEVQAVKPVLDDAIACALALYEAEKDNVGDNEGQRPQEVVDAFKNAIDTAAAIADPTEADLNALLDAREAFINGVIGINRTALRNAIAKAEGEEFSNLVAGDFNGNYPAETIDAFNVALQEAKEAEANMDMTQEQIDAATKKLNDAMATLKASIVTINFNTLDNAIAAAQEALAGVTVIGDSEGACPQAVVDALNAVVEEAEGIDRDAINQADTDALAAQLTEATALFNEQMRASTGLAEAIAEAQALVDNAVSGFKPGNYPITAIEALKAVTENAEQVLANQGATQAELLDALNALKEEMAIFATQVIPAHDLTELNQLIEQAEAFMAANDYNDDFILNIALQDAKDLVADPDNYTKAQLNSITEALREALDYAIGTVGVADTLAEDVAINVAGGTLSVSGIATDATVAVYSLDGRLIAIDNASAEISLSTGKYVVAIRSSLVNVTRTIFVK